MKHVFREGAFAGLGWLDVWVGCRETGAGFNLLVCIQRTGSDAGLGTRET